MQYPNIDPVLLDLGFIQIHWYGFMYLVGFTICYVLGNRRAKQRPELGWNAEQISDVVFYGALGVIIGGRIGYVLVYGWDKFVENPLFMFKIWEGGMSFHGGAAAVIALMWLFARKTDRHFLDVTDYIAPLAPLGLGMVRIANFINAELWGRPTDLPWGMVFPGAGPEPRHPSQLYEAFFEGFLLFAVLWIVSAKPRKRGVVSGLFLVGYGLARFMVEFARQPDAHMGEQGIIGLGWMTTGQLLSIPMILGGLICFVYAWKYPAYAETRQAAAREKRAAKV